MASDSLLKVIAGLVKREATLRKEDAKKAKEALKAKAEQDDEEEDEDEAPVGDQDNPETEPEPKAEKAKSKTEQEPEDEEEPEPEAEPEGEPEPEDDGAGDTKASGPDPALVQQVANIVVAQLSDMMKKQQDAEKAKKYDDGETKLSGKKEKIDTKPKLEQTVKRGKMNFREAMRMSVTGTHLAEGYEEAVLDILEDEKIDGPLGYEPFFEKGKLFVEKGSEKKAAKVLKQSKDINKVPKIVGETTEFQVFEDLEDLEAVHQELATSEQVDVDGRKRGFREALKRLTYEKIQQLKKEGAAEFMAAASAAKREGKKKFKFGGKEYPVTIKVDIPLKGEK